MTEEKSASTESREASGKKRGYVKYSPFSLLLLSICAFVVSFSLLGIFEQSLLDTAGESVQGELIDLAFPDLGEGDNNVLSPTQTPNLNSWQNVVVTDIDPQSLPFLQTVNFSALRAENSDTKAWLYFPTTADVKGLPISMPVVQTTDNSYYLNHSFDRTYSDNGWVYADYRNNMTSLKSNRNLIFYGHARSYRIFGGLKYLNTQTTWQKDGYNHFLYVNTPYEKTVWQIFSWYETSADFNYIATEFSSGDDYVSFLNTLQDKNEIPAFERFLFTEDCRILTLSTCKGADENMRVAVHAVLVKYERTNSLGNPVDTDVPGFPSGIGTGTVSKPSSDSSSSTDGGDISTDGGNPTDTPVSDGSGGTGSDTTDITTDSSGGATDDPVTDGGSDSSDATDSAGGSSDTTDDGGGTTDAPEDSDSSDSSEGGDSSSDVSTDSDSSTDSSGSSDTGTPTDTPVQGGTDDEDSEEETPSDEGSSQT